jgi:hypothetical protein
MSQFKSKEEYAVEATRISVVFHVHVAEGIIPLEQKGTEQELQAQLLAIAKDGLTLPSQHGFTWYPCTSIRKVVVEAQ